MTETDSEKEKDQDTVYVDGEEKEEKTRMKEMLEEMMIDRDLRG